MQSLVVVAGFAAVEALSNQTEELHDKRLTDKVQLGNVWEALIIAAAFVISAVFCGCIVACIARYCERRGESLVT